MTTETTNTNEENILTNVSFAATQMMLSQAFLNFVHSTIEAISPTTFNSKAQWAIEHDKKWDYNTQIVLNSESKNKLDNDYKFLISPDGSAQQVLHLMEESKPTNRDEEKIKNRTIAYINKWFELITVFYDSFLLGVTLDKESFEDKYARVRSELINQTNKVIIHDYVDYMKEHEEWGSEDVLRFLAGDDPFAVIPESFSQSYYADLDLLE